VVKFLNATCSYDRTYGQLGNDSALRLMNVYLPKYLNQIKTTTGLGTPEQQAIRTIAHEFLYVHPAWIVAFHNEKIAVLTDAVLQEVSNEVLSKSDAIKILDLLGANTAGIFSDRFTLATAFVTFFYDVIHLHSRVRSAQKSKVYIETSFDLAFSLIKQFPSLIVQNREEVFYFLNWAISMYIREPDVAGILQNIKTIFTADAILPPLLKNVTESHISPLVRFITALIELKHQSLVLPQQSLLPLQCLPQFTNVSLHIGFEMIRKFGHYLRETKEHEYVWRNDFVALLDRMCEVNDPQVRLEAWNVETLIPK